MGCNNDGYETGGTHSSGAIGRTSAASSTSSGSGGGDGNRTVTGSTSPCAGPNSPCVGPSGPCACPDDTRTNGSGRYGYRDDGGGTARA